MVSNTAQISVKAALEAMLAWKVFDIDKPLNGMPNKKRDIFHIVVTPDRIPKFIIPSLEVDHVFLQVEPVEGDPDAEREITITQQDAVSPRSKRSHSESNIRKAHFSRGRSLCRTVSDYSPGKLEKVADHSDPPTRAALSLPHLPKITTPYGFLALGESPNIRRKESLFFDPDVSEIPTVPPMKTGSTARLRNPSSPLRRQQSHHKIPTTPRDHAVPLSWEVLCCPTPCPTSSPSSSSSKGSSKCEKKRFNFLRRKHLPGVKCLKCNGK